METLDKKNINDEKYWDAFYGRTETEPLRQTRLFFYRNVVKYLHKKGRKTLLEIGCGTGHGLNYLSTVNKNYKYIGFDLSAEAIEAGKIKYPYLKLAQGDILKHNIRRYYDDILIVQTLEHFYKPLELVDKLLNNCHRLIISVPFEKCLSNGKAHMSTGFTKKGFAGYKVLAHEIVARKKRKKFLYIILMGIGEKHRELFG